MDVIGRELARILLAPATVLPRWNAAEVERDISRRVARVRMFPQSVRLKRQRVREDHEATSAARRLVTREVLSAVMLLERAVVLNVLMDVASLVAKVAREMTLLEMKVELDGSRRRRWRSWWWSGRMRGNDRGVTKGGRWWRPTSSRP